MSVGEEKSTKTLNWIKPEIDESLKKARQSLEIYIQNQDNHEQLQFIAHQLHQTCGTLQMVEQYGASMLAEEMEHVISALKEDKIKQKDDAFEVSMRALLQLSAYLDHLNQGYPDTPITLLPLLNDLRATRGQQLLSESAFFSPDLSVLPDSARDQDSHTPETEDLEHYKKKLRTLYQTGLLGLFRNEDVVKNLTRLNTVIEKLESISKQDGGRQLWWIGGGLIEALYENGLEANVSVKTLLGNIDRMIKIYISDGEPALIKQISPELLKNILFYIAQAKSNGPKVSTLKKAFSLDHILPTHLTESGSEFIGLNKDVIQNVSQAIKEDVLSIKDSLDMFVRAKDQPVSELQPLSDRLRTVADTLGILGFGKLRSLINEQEEVVKSIIAKSANLEDSTVMGIASALLFVESSINDLRMFNNDYKDGQLPNGENDTLLPDAEYRQLVQITITEAKSVLASIKDAIMSFAVDHSNKDALSETPKLVGEIKGAFVILSFGRAADLINSCNKYITQELLEADHPPKTEDLDALADVITGIEYFLENVEEDSSNARKSLDIAEEGLVNLGFPPEHLEPQAESQQEKSDHDKAKSQKPDTAMFEEPLVAEEVVEEILEENSATVQTNVETTQDNDLDDEVMEIFIEEAEEELASVTEQLVLWKADNKNKDALTMLRRSFHTLKGSGRIVGATDIGDFAWSIESMLNKVIDGIVKPSPGLFTVLDSAKEVLPFLIKQIKTGSSEPIEIKFIIDNANRIIAGEDIAIADSSQPEVTVDSDAQAEEQLQIIKDAEQENVLQEEMHVPTEKTEFSLESAEDDEPLDLEQVDDNVPDKEQTVVELTQNNDLASEPTLEEPSEEQPKTYDPILVEIFSNETTIHLTTIRSFVTNCQENKLDCRVNNDLVRATHTLHGSSHLAGINDIAELTEILEKYLKLANENKSRLESGELELLLHSADAIEKMTSDLDQINPCLQNKLELIEKTKEYLHIENMLQKERFKILEESSDSLSPLSETSMDRELLSIFINEADEITERTSNLYKNWQQEPNNTGIVEDIRRDIHTLQGGAKVAELPLLREMSNKLSNVLSRTVKKEIAPNEEVQLLVSQTLDWISGAIDALREYKQISPAIDLAQNLDNCIHTQSIVTPPEREIVDATEPQDEQLQSHSNETEHNSLEFPVESDNVVSFADHLAEHKLTPIKQDPLDDDLVEIFFEEATEILANMDNLLQQWSQGHDQAEIINQLQRALHTLKGGARMADIAPIGDLSHSIESILQQNVTVEKGLTPVLVEILHSAHDWIQNSLDKIKMREPLDSATNLIEEIEIAAGIREMRAVPVSTPIIEEIIEEEIIAEPDKDALEKVTDETEANELAIASIIEAAEATAPRPIFIEKKTRPIGELVRVSAELLDNLVNHSGELSIYRSRIEQQLNAMGYNLTEFGQTISRVQDQLRKFEIEAEAQILFRYEESGSPEVEQFDPLELDRFSNMQQLSRALLESVGDLTSIQKLLENLTRESEILLLQQSRVNSELQEGLMRTRLVPFSNIVPRLRRIVRQTAKELNKKAELHIVGSEGEMDRTVLDKMVPALEHMLRNAIDHGIELPEERSKANKQETGQITLAFSREGQEIVLKISDDGAGIDLKVIRKKAIKNELMTKNAKLSDNEILQFILESGFSTAKNITQISGRGVGMDIVNTEIKQLSGSLTIDSEFKLGSNFTVRLPLTVSINQALMVNAGEETYAIPLPSIEGIIRVNNEKLSKLRDKSTTTYKYGSTEYQFFHLGLMLNVSNPEVLEPNAKIPIILARAGEHRIALEVDAIRGRQEIVVKNVGPQISSVKGISGATILGDGSVALILDITSLVRTGLARLARIDTAPAPIVEQVVIPEKVKTITVMVVDDSITVRKVTERLLKRNNMNSITAKDGVDALAVLQEQMPDLMLLDIEMPRMDGYELATAIRNDKKLSHLPIIMITSRTGDKHKDRAMSIGVNEYMGKPYQESELLENIHKLLNERG